MIKCRKSAVQNYECQVVHKVNGQWVAFDACLAKELFSLWDRGIETVGSCCGKHINSDEFAPAFIQVAERDISKMIKLGYAVDPYYKYKPCNSFIPKSCKGG